MAALPIETTPHEGESAGGLMLRALAANGTRVREMLAMTRGSARRILAPEDVGFFSELTGIAEHWFSDRIPLPVPGDRWTELELFRHRWRNDWTLRGQHCQVCPRCLREFGFARVEWDLTCYVACTVHRLMLVDRCHACGRALLPDRPAVDICSCGRYLESRSESELEASEPLLAWSRWISAQLLSSLSMASVVPDPPTKALCGLSPDGGFRLAVALGGGSRELRGALLNSATPWLATAAVCGVLLNGLDALIKLDAGKALDAPLGLGCGDALSEQAVRGITQADRHAAACMQKRLKLPSRWRNVKRSIHLQGDLFEGWAC